MTFRAGLVFVIAALFVLVGCEGEKDSKKAEPKLTKAERAKHDALDKAKAAFEKKNDDVNLCRDLALKYMAVASPESTGDPKKAPKMPKDREKNLNHAVETLEECQKIDTKNTDVQQMLASSYMATGKYDKAAALLKKIAATSKGERRANDHYAWGLAASNSQNIPDAIKAWEGFLKYAPKSDPRVPQVQQSIKSLKEAQKNQKAQKAAASKDSK